MQLNTCTTLQFWCCIFVYLYICNFLSTRETKSTFGRLWCNLTQPHNNCGQCSLICLAILFLLSHDNNTPQSSHIGGRKQQCSFNNVAQWTLHRYGSGSTIPFSFFWTNRVHSGSCGLIYIDFHCYLTFQKKKNWNKQKTFKPKRKGGVWTEWKELNLFKSQSPVQHDRFRLTVIIQAVVWNVWLSLKYKCPHFSKSSHAPNLCPQLLTML